MASILDLLRSKNPDLSLDDARSAMGLPKAQQSTNPVDFDMLGNIVPKQEDRSLDDATLMAPLQKEVPAEPQIYREGFDPIAAQDVERNPVGQEPAKVPASEPKPLPAPKGLKATVRSDQAKQEDMGDKFDPSAKQESKSSADKNLEDQYAKEDKDAQDETELEGELNKPQATPAASSLAEQFAAAQKKQADAQEGAMWAKLGARIGGAIGHQSKDVIKDNMDMADMIASRGGRDLQQIEQKLAFQKQDPESDYSKRAKEFLTSKFNIQPEMLQGLSADQLDKTFMGPALKSFEAEETRKAAVAKQLGEERIKKELQKEKAQDRLEQIKTQAELNAPMKEALLGIRRESLENTKRATQDRNDRQILTQHEHLSKLLNPDTAPVSSGIGQANRRIQFADRAKGLIAQYAGHLDQIPPEQVGELYIALNATIAPGSPSQGNLKRIIPSSALGSVAKLQEYFMNAPKGAQQGKFVENVLHSLDSEKQVAIDQIKKAQIHALSTNKQIMDARPDLYQNLLDTAGISPEELVFNKKAVGSSSGKIRVRKGNETLEISPDDLKHAEKDGYRKVD